MIIDNKFIKDYTDHVNDLLYIRDHSLSDEDMGDLNQEVFYKALLYVDYYDKSKGSVSTWLGMLVKHVYSRYLRDRDQLNVSSYEDDSTEAFSVTKDDLLYPENDHYYYTNRDEVDRFINMLPPKQRDVVYLKLILGHTYTEISSQVQATESTNRSNFEAGIKNLKRLIESEHPDQIVLNERNVLKPYGDKGYSGDWAWRPNESPDRCNSEVKIFNTAEIKEYCLEHNLQQAGE